MSRPLWPPNYTRIPILMLTYRTATGQRLPAGALETYADLRALAWARTETDALAFEALRTATGKGRSTILAHLALLKACCGLRYELTDGHLVVHFDDAGDAADRVQESGLVQKAGPAPASNLPGNRLSPESRTPDSPLKDLKDIKPDLKTEGPVQNSGLTSKKPDSDPRSKHPAIQACRKLTNSYPDKTLYDRIIEALGEQPDPAKLKRCRVEWQERGFNPRSWKWATEWYVNGIPEQGRPAPKAIRPAVPAVPPPDQEQQARLREQVRQHKEANRAKNR